MVEEIKVEKRGLQRNIHVNNGGEMLPARQVYSKKIILANEKEGETLTLDAKVVQLREEMRDGGGRAILYIHNFSMKTIACLQMLVKEFNDRLVDDVWFRFAEEFTLGDLRRLCDVMEHREVKLFEGKRFNVIIKKG